jgi:hypothetical protein
MVALSWRIPAVAPGKPARSATPCAPHGGRFPASQSARICTGWRKAAAALRAQAGCSVRGIAAVTGHKNPQQVQLYTAE